MLRSALTLNFSLIRRLTPPPERTLTALHHRCITSDKRQGGMQRILNPGGMDAASLSPISAGAQTHTLWMLSLTEKKKKKQLNASENWNNKCTRIASCEMCLLLWTRRVGDLAFVERRFYAIWHPELPSRSIHFCWFRWYQEELDRWAQESVRSSFSQGVTKRWSFNCVQNHQKVTQSRRLCFRQIYDEQKYNPDSELQDTSSFFFSKWQTTFQFFFCFYSPNNLLFAWPTRIIMLFLKREKKIVWLV